MKKYYVFYNKSNNKYEVRVANIIEEVNGTVTLIEEDKTFKKRAESIFDTKEYANIVRKEMITCKTFKTSVLKKSKKYYICPYCGRRIKKDEVTIDHKIPKRYFKRIAKDKYNIEDLRLSEDLWRQCWNYNNLQLICRDCNNKKSSSSEILNKYIVSKAYKSKKYESVNKGCRKVHITNNNWLSKDLEEDILKKFGNTFDIKDIKNI